MKLSWYLSSVHSCLLIGLRLFNYASIFTDTCYVYRGAFVLHYRLDFRRSFESGLRSSSGRGEAPVGCFPEHRLVIDPGLGLLSFYAANKMEISNCSYVMKRFGLCIHSWSINALFNSPEGGGMNGPLLKTLTFFWPKSAIFPSHIYDLTKTSI